MACSLYIDDRLNGELFTSVGFWSRPINQRDSFQAAEAALFTVSKVLVHLGYFLGNKKCVLTPVMSISYLGMIVDSSQQAFLVPGDKREKFAHLRENILGYQSSVPLKSIQRFMGKCISFSLAFPGAKFYIREMAASIGKADGGREVQFSPLLREEIQFWRFLDNWDKCIPWRQERHVAISVPCDASLFRWAAVFHLNFSEFAIGDY